MEGDLVWEDESRLWVEAGVSEAEEAREAGPREETLPQPVAEEEVGLRRKKKERRKQFQS